MINEILIPDNIEKRDATVKENYKRYQHKKAKDRKRLIKEIKCLNCGTAFDSKLKKVTRIKRRSVFDKKSLNLMFVEYTVKELEPLNQFCDHKKREDKKFKCNNQHILFRSKLARMKMSENKDDRLVAHYVFIKIFMRVPTNILMRVLDSKMNPNYRPPKPYKQFLLK